WLSRFGRIPLFRIAVFAFYIVHPDSEGFVARKVTLLCLSEF
ncbi:MAG: hypothetical protein ACI823_000877, partial [Chitinophagales bacterium]